MPYVLVGLSHKTAPVEIREKLAIPPPKIPETLEGLIRLEEIQEAMLVSTCNRVEAYLVARHLERGSAIARRLLSELGKIPESQLASCLYAKGDRDAVAHLFRVVASLDSMVVGEPQISGQVKEAYTQAVAQGTTGTYLNRLVHRSLRVSKRIRSETAIGHLPVSISFAAVLLASRIFDRLREKTVLVLGAGEMAVLACRHLWERQVTGILIANRTFAKAQALAREFDGEAVPLAPLEPQLARADIILSSLEAKEPLISRPMVEEAMARRRGRAMFFVDLGVPRTVASEVNRIENVYLYDIDDLNGVVEANKREREKEAHRAEGIVAEEVESFFRNIREMEVTPTILELSKKFDGIRRRELERFFARHPGISTGERKALEAMTGGIVNKILHEPIILMKTEEAHNGGPKYSEILKKLFNLGKS